ncbi:MAG: 23S rRNA (uracil(1939)-C(5))-methyltransferase RlmD [Gammaproteobacteria bacterium]
MARRSSRAALAKLPLFEVSIESLSPEGRGVAHRNGKVIFIDQALPQETVQARYLRRRSKRDEAEAVDILQPAADRVVPDCPHYGVCGGCRLQHMEATAQLRFKQTVLLQQLQHIGRVVPENIRAPMTGPVWGYRHKARLGVKYVVKKNRLLVGFRERSKPYIAELDQCKVLHPRVGMLLTPLAELIAGLSNRDQIAQIEVAIGATEDTESAAGQVVLVLRNLGEFSNADYEQLREFGEQYQSTFMLQPGGLDSITPLPAAARPQLYYDLPAHDIRLDFQPFDFTQVNPDINRQLVDAVCAWLDLETTDRVLDLFCGLGNFSLPIARQVAQVTGVEGDENLVARARMNAQKNNITNAGFICLDLMAADLEAAFLHERYNKVVIDPPRSGAADIIVRLPWQGVEQIAYVSCNPATLARDAGELVRQHGFRLAETGVLDMFPHTAHVESLALFVKQ